MPRRQASTVTLVTSQVVRISDGAPRHPLRLHLAADGHIDADIAVLAIGTPRPPPRSPYRTATASSPTPGRQARCSGSVTAGRSSCWAPA